MMAKFCGHLFRHIVFCDRPPPSFNHCFFSDLSSIIDRHRPYPSVLCHQLSGVDWCRLRAFRVLMLTDNAALAAAARDRSYKLSDSGGLYLFVTPKGGKSWRLKYRHLSHARGRAPRDSERDEGRTRALNEVCLRGKFYAHCRHISRKTSPGAKCEPVSPPALHQLARTVGILPNGAC